MYWKPIKLKLNQVVKLAQYNSRKQSVELVNIEEEECIPVARLPCESPAISSSGVLVFGREADPSTKTRSVSTSVNRVEFPEQSLDLPSTSPLSKSKEEIMVWDEASYSGYRLNCHKK